MKSSQIVRSAIIASLIVAVLANARPALALVASDYVGGGTLGNFGNVTGWYFSPNVNIFVTNLGLYDHDASGFASSHDVGIFLNGGATVVTASLGPGLSGTFVPGTVNGTRVVPVAPTMLLAGQTYYTVANNFSTDTYAYGTGAVTHAPQITWLGFGDGSSNSIFSPVTNFGGLPGNTGPNFLFELVPEPTSFIIACFAMIGLAGCRCSRDS